MGASVLFISHISSPTLLTLEYYLAALCQSHAAATTKLIKETYMTCLIQLMNKTVFLHNCTTAYRRSHSYLKTQVILKPVGELGKYKMKNPGGFPDSCLLQVRQCIYSVLRQDAPRRQPEGIMERWGVHSSAAEIWFRKSKEECDAPPSQAPFPFSGILLFDHWENWEQNWRTEGREMVKMLDWRQQRGKKGEKKKRNKPAAAGRSCYQRSNMTGSDMWSAGKGNQTDID